MSLRPFWNSGSRDLREGRPTIEIQALQLPRMNAYQSRLLLLVFAGLFALSGASCPRFLRQYTNQQPRLLPAPPATPTLDQVIQVVNHNNSQIQSYLANNATLSLPGYPSLRANVAYQRVGYPRPSRFRLRAEMMTGAECDLGSNEELFWFWIKRDQPPAVYYCRHDQYAASQARQTMPIQPDWLIEAVGIGEIDPALPHQGPYSRPNDRLEIRTIRDTPQGPTTKITILDGSQGWILEQGIVDARGQLLASSKCSEHRLDPASGLVMPTVVQVSCPPAKFSMRLDLGKVQINGPLGNPAELWNMPTYPPSQLVNLGAPAPMGPPQNGQPMPPPQTPLRSSSAAAAWRQRTR